MNKIQQSKKFKIIDKERILKIQNEIRKKYGLRPLRRLQAEMILYLQKDFSVTEKDKNIFPFIGGMYQ